MVMNREPYVGVLWHCLPLASSEYASLRQDSDEVHLHGVVVLPRDTLPCRIEYHVVVDRRWFPVSAAVTVTTPLHVHELRLAADASLRWRLNDESAPVLEGCSDIDLGWTPATNTIPIRRLDLNVGESNTITAGWIRFPELDVVKSEQTYERLAADRWRYRSGEYDFELVTDAASGLVMAYGEDLWKAVATVESPRRTT